MAKLQRIRPGPAWPLHDIATTRRLEQRAMQALPAHELMRRAGQASARLALALAPHARCIWIACGPGNNGGDGMEAAMHLRNWGLQPWVTWIGRESALPADAAAALRRARAAQVRFEPAPPRELEPGDLCLDALLGMGANRAPTGQLADWLHQLRASRAPLLSLDVPSGLNADTGTWFAGASDPAAQAVGRRHTLALLTAKPGYFTAHGRDACGTLWLDDLGVDTAGSPPVAELNPAPPPRVRAHASHKGSYGDVAVLGGAGSDAGTGMYGAAVLAASAALHAGAGRVYLALLDPTGNAWAANQPELMLRRPAALDCRQLTVVCGCGGGTEIAGTLPRVLEQAPALVLDADALNAIATEPRLQHALRARANHPMRTVLTPHPLEAARLLGTTAAQVQADRLHAAHALCDRFGCTLVLKGSGTVIATPGQRPALNPTGGARLATAGSGDVLAGMVGAALARGLPAHAAACAATFEHGLLADRWPAGVPLTAAALARQAPAAVQDPFTAPPKTALRSEAV